MNRLKEIRQQHGMTQTDVAKALKLRQASISQWEHGKIPTADVLQLYADYFGVSLDYLMGRDTPVTRNSPASSDSDAQVAFGASLANGAVYEDLSPVGQALMEEYRQYLRSKYPKEG